MKHLKINHAVPVLVISAIFGSAGLTMLGCGPSGGPDQDDTGDDIVYDVHSNPDDALALKATNRTGETAEIYGLKNADGELLQIDRIRVQTADDLANNQETWIYLDPQTGGLDRIVTGAGDVLQFDLSDPARIQWSMIVAGGEAQVHAGADLPVSAQSDPTESGGDSMTSSDGASQDDSDSGSDDDGMLDDDDDFNPDAPPGDCRGDIDCGEDEICFEGDCLPIIDFRIRADEDCEALVNVVQCGEPVTGADVYVIRSVSVPPVTTPTTRVFPARPTQSPGLYSVCLPVEASTLTPAAVDNLCQKAAQLYGLSCNFSDVVRANQVPICVGLAGAVDFLVGGPTGEAAPLFAKCEAALNAWLLSCVLFASDGRNPTPTAGDAICAGIRTTADAAADLAAASIEIEAFADVQGQRTFSRKERVSARGEFPTLTIDLGSSPRITDFAVAPRAPRVGEAYTINATIACANVGTVTIDVAGDGYSSSEVFFPVSNAAETFTLSVPAGLSDEVHTVSLLALPFGGGTGASRQIVVDFRQVCDDTCATANNRICEDGGPNTEFFVGAPCELGTDCTDCNAPRGECERDSDCTDAGLDPFCVDHQCVECELSTDCPENNLCNEDHECEPRNVDCPADDQCELDCPGIDPDCAQCDFDGTCIGGCEPADPDCADGTFIVLSYFNTDCIPGIPGAPTGPAGACGQLPTLNAELADIQLSGTASDLVISFPALRDVTQVSVVRTESSNPLLTENVYGIESDTDEQTGEPHFLPNSVRYGDYGVPGSRPMFGATTSPPLLSGAQASYVVAVASVDGLSQMTFQIAP